LACAKSLSIKHKKAEPLGGRRRQHCSEHIEQ